MLGHVAWSCRVRNTRLWHVLSTSTAGSSHRRRGRESGARRKRQEDETTCIGYRTTLFERARATTTDGAREDVQHYQTHWNSVKCCHNEARRHLPKRTLHLMFMPYNAWELRKNNHQRPTIFETRTKAELSGKGVVSRVTVLLFPLCTAFCVSYPIRFHIVAQWLHDFT